MSTFNVKAKGQCYQCGKVGHQARDCWNSQQNNNGNGTKQGNQTRYAPRGQRSTQRGYSRGAAHRGYSRGRGSGHQRERSNEQYESPHESWVTQVEQVKVNQVSDSVDENEIEWLLDSGCTDHVINNKKYQCNYVNLTNPIYVNLPHDKILKATKIGDVKTYFKTWFNETEVHLKNVYFFEAKKRNLLSFSKITENNTIVARNDIARIFNKNRKLTVLATKINGLYYMKSFCNEKVEDNNNVYVNSVKLTDKEK